MKTKTITQREFTKLSGKADSYISLWTGGKISGDVKGMVKVRETGQTYTITPYVKHIQQYTRSQLRTMILPRQTDKGRIKIINTRLKGMGVWT